MPHRAAAEATRQRVARLSGPRPHARGGGRLRRIASRNSSGPRPRQVRLGRSRGAPASSGDLRRLAVARVVHPVERQRLDRLIRPPCSCRRPCPSRRGRRPSRVSSRRGSGGSPAASNSRRTQSPPFMTTKRSSAEVRSSRTSPKPRVAGRPCRPSAAAVSTSSWTKTWGPSGVSRVIGARSRGRRGAAATAAPRDTTGGAGVLVHGVGDAVPVDREVRPDPDARVGAGRGRPERSTRHRLGLARRDSPSPGIAAFHPPRPSGTSSTGPAGRASPSRCDRETLIDVSAVEDPAGQVQHDRAAPARAFGQLEHERRAARRSPGSASAIEARRGRRRPPRAISAVRSRPRSSVARGASGRARP